MVAKTTRFLSEITSYIYLISINIVIYILIEKNKLDLDNKLYIG
jgi:hypothetical protein